MALHFDLCVNGVPIGQFVAQRREMVVDRVCTYDITINAGGMEHRATVRHNFERGAWPLVATALQTMDGTEEPAASDLDRAMHSVWLHGSDDHQRS